MKKSVWSETKMPEFKSLEGDIKTDVLIIGGGIAGLLCAYKLHNKGVDYILAEGESIAGKTTENTTGKITSCHSLIYSSIDAKYGKERAQLYLSANERAIDEYEKAAANIKCDFERRNAYTYSLTDQRVIEREVETVNNLGVKAGFVKKTELPFDIKGAIKFPNQAQFNPLKFLSEISKELNIYENTFVEKVDGNRAITDKGSITAEKIIVATHFPLINRYGGYFAKMYQHRSYVTAIDNVPVIDGMYVDYDKKGMSFRGYKNYILIGGGGHRTGKKGGGWEEINTLAKACYPTGRVKYMWAAQDCSTLDEMPYIGRYSKNTQDLYVATGFNKWGMTGSMVASGVLCDMVMGKRNEYEDLFSPQRNMYKSALLANGLETVVNFLNPTKRRCTHLGCALKWNRNEHSWDCPCHGSRFDEKGNVLENPAKENL